MPYDKITLFCFAASYAVALGLELLEIYRPGRWQDVLRLLFAGAGLLAHTLFLLVQQPALSSQFGSLLFLAWILAVFYLFGSIHHAQVAWGVFVLPLVFLLVLIAALFSPEPGSHESGFTSAEGLKKFWGILHGVLLLLAAVGISIGFIASIMYLVQARRLKAKVLPGQGLKMLSLERLEEMNRRAVNLAFPLLTAGFLVGAGLLIQEGAGLRGLTDPKVFGIVVLWIVFASLLYLRYWVHLSGRRLAFLTILAFGLLVATLTAPSHQFGL
jgi:ABC-type transport system involved in cytochrome c biogenesis permease subunit